MNVYKDDAFVSYFSASAHLDFSFVIFSRVQWHGCDACINHNQMQCNANAIK